MTVAENSRTPQKRRRIRRQLLALFLLLFFGIPAVKVLLTTPQPGAVTLSPLLKEKIRYTVCVITYGYHSAIVVEQPRGWQLGPPGNQNARFVEYGWGDRRFYGSEDHSMGVILPALFWGTSSVVYIDGGDTPPTQTHAFRSVYERSVTPDQLRQLVTVLEQAIVRTPEGGRSDPLPARTGVNGRFYLAREQYIFWSDCNRWTVERLHRVGLATGGFGVLVNTQIAGRLTGFEKRR
jgi:hypothetical protein